MKVAFLNNPLEEETYVTQPEVFASPDNPDMVYLLPKALNGLKQACRAWHKFLHGFLLSLNFEAIMVDNSMYGLKMGE